MSTLYFVLYMIDYLFTVCTARTFPSHSTFLSDKICLRRSVAVTSPAKSILDSTATSTNLASYPSTPIHADVSAPDRESCLIFYLSTCLAAVCANSKSSSGAYSNQLICTGLGDFEVTRWPFQSCLHQLSGERIQQVNGILQHLAVQLLSRICFISVPPRCRKPDSCLRVVDNGHLPSRSRKGHKHASAADRKRADTARMQYSGMRSTLLTTVRPLRYGGSTESAPPISSLAYLLLSLIELTTL